MSTYLNTLLFIPWHASLFMELAKFANNLLQIIILCNYCSYNSENIKLQETNNWVQITSPRIHPTSLLIQAMVTQILGRNKIEIRSSNWYV